MKIRYRCLVSCLLLVAGVFRVSAAESLIPDFTADERLELKGTPWQVPEVKAETLRLRPLPLTGEAVNKRRLRRGERLTIKGKNVDVVMADAESALLTLPGTPTQTLGAFITPVDAKASSFQSPMSPQKTIDGTGWGETYPGSGDYRHAEGSWQEGGRAWSSQGGAVGGWISFDLGQKYSVDGAYIWNYNEGGGYNTRSVKQVRITTSIDGKTWTPVGDYDLACAPGQNGYAGQALAFGKVVEGRQIKFESLGNYRNGENIGLSEVRFSNATQKAVAAGTGPWKATYARPHFPTGKQGAPLAKAENLVFPDGPNSVIDLSKPPYDLTGDGVTDVTGVLNKAFNDHANVNAILYLPNGIYLVSDTIRWGGGTDMHGGGTAKFTVLQGQSRDGTVIRLLDSCLGYDGAGKAVVCTGWAPAQRFANEVRNLTIDTGLDNPGATALQFIANNQGGAYDLCLRSGDGQGKVGLDLGYTDEQGPSLMRNIWVKGFDVGMSSATSVASYTAENITLEDQNVVGFRNGGQPSSIRRLISRNAVPAVVNGSGLLTLIEPELVGKGAAAKLAAVTNTGTLFVRDLRGSGYLLAVDDKIAQRTLPGPKVAEHRTQDKPFGNGPASTLRLPIKETPDLPWDAPDTWARPETFGGKPNDDQDDAAAIQQAIDSGATTVFLGHGNWRIGSTVHLRGKVRRLIGGRCWLVSGKPLQDSQDAMFRLDEGEAPVVVVERIATGFDGGTFAFIEHNAKRTLVLRQICENFQGDRVGGYRTGEAGTGDVFFEDVCTGRAVFRHQQVWARQLNCEGAGPIKVLNDGATVWVLGYKAEKRDTLFITRGGGKTEILGGLMQTSDGGSQVPMFLNEDGAMSVVFCETNWSNSPYDILIRQVKDGQTSELAPKDRGFKGFRAIFYEGR